MKLFALAERIEALPQAYYYYVVRQGSITRNAKADRNREILEALSLIHIFIWQNRPTTERKAR